MKIDEGLWIDGTIIWKGGESLHQAETCVGILVDDSQRTRNRQACTSKHEYFEGLTEPIVSSLGGPTWFAHMQC